MGSSRTIPSPSYTPLGGSGTVAPSAGTSTSPGSPSGREIYGGRSYPTEGGTITPNDSAQGPSAGAGDSTAGPAAPWVAPERTASRVRFPAPYSPAGSRRDGATTAPSSRGVVTRSVTPDASARKSFSSARPIDTGSGSAKSPTKTTGRPSLGYDRGPTRRFDAPAPTKLDGNNGGSRSGGLKPVKSGSNGTGGKGATVGKSNTPQWRDLRQTKPEAARTVSTATRIAGRVSAVAVGVGVGAVGGVHPGGYWGGGGSGGDCWYNDPYGCSGWSVSFCYSSCWWGWAWPCYWACYYPYWWWCSYPYYSYYPYYGVASTIVVESEPQVVYVEQQPAEYAAAAAVGEGAVQQAPAAAAPNAAALTIAAQRYLELGDRAFREGRYTDAVQFYAKAVEFAPDQGALYLVLADALFAAGDYHYGAYAIRRALELDASLVETTVDKHSFYSDPALFDQQLAALERYLSEHSADRDARLVLALNYLFANRATDATRVLEASPSDEPAAQAVLQQARARAR